MSHSPLARFSAEVRALTLDNGLAVFTLQDPEADVVSVQTWIGAGSAAEEPDQEGAAHLLEHLLFRGTAAVPDGELDRRMEAMGASINAWTSTDATCFTVTAPADALDEVLWLEADRFAGSNPSQEVFAAEHEVVLNERRAAVESDPESQAEEAFLTLCFGDSPYGRPILGRTPQLAALREGELRRFLLRWYHPQNAAVVIVGAFDPDALQATLQRTWGAWTPRGAAPTAPGWGYAPRRRQNVALPVASRRLMAGWPLAAWGSHEHQAAWLAMQLLVGSGSAPITRRFILEEALAFDVFADAEGSVGPGVAMVGFTPRPGVSLRALERAWADELQRFVASGPTPDAVDEAIARALVAEAAQLGHSSHVAHLIGEGWRMGGDPRALFAWFESLPTLSISALREVARPWAAEAPWRLSVRPLSGGRA